MKLSSKILAIGAFSLTVAACIPPQIAFPVVGRLSNGEEAQGNIVIDTRTYQGTIDVSTLRGLECNGNYSAKGGSPTITIPIKCNNGQTGKVIATRDATGLAGTATARLSNGMTGRFVFGNISAGLQAEFLKQ